MCVSVCYVRVFEKEKKEVHSYIANCFEKNFCTRELRPLGMLRSVGL
jgi:hypothetical protein